MAGGFGRLLGLHAEHVAAQFVTNLEQYTLDAPQPRFAQRARISLGHDALGGGHGAGNGLDLGSA